MRHLEAQLVHDMRNGASAIAGAATLLRSRGDVMGRSDLDRLHEMIGRRAELLLRLLEDVRLLGLLDKGELTVSRTLIDCPSFLSAVAGDVETTKSVTIAVAPGTRTIADPLRLTQVIENLVTNALRYGGETIELSAFADGDQAVLTITDDGPGVPQRLVDSIFDEFARGESSGRHGGTGLGLAIVRQLSELMDGEVTYRHDQGARFEVRLPGPVARSPIGHEAAHVAGHTVRFWDDEADFIGHLGGFAFDGLCLGDGVVLAATADHFDAVLDSLFDRSVDVDRALSSGQLVHLDAHDARDAITVDGVVEPAAFRGSIERALVPVLDDWSRTRVFGEVVDLFWQNGDIQAALGLEACWNSLRSHRSFSVHCSYRIDLAAGGAPPDLCACHDDVVAA